jgi:hypothetical protein|tara:strand:+ start:90 stop:398 length:309 start_codon:yes stop_codon:yes gene_type:complete
MAKESVDYELVPASDGGGNKQAWDVRFIEGDFVETVIRYGNIAFENDCLKFNFMIQSSPDGDLTEEDTNLQDFAADVLEDILEAAAQDGSLVYGKPEEDNED